MNSALTGKFQAFSISEETANDHRLVRAAEVEGYKFITLRAKESLMEEQELRFGNIFRLRFFQDRGLRDGRPRTSFNVEQGHLVFRYDPQARAHIAFLWDDDQPGVVSETGYNRDFLASHMDRAEWIIEDREVEKDVRERLQRMKHKAADKAQQQVEGPLSQENMDNMTLESIEAQLDFLMKMKEQRTGKPDGLVGVDGQPMVSKTQTQNNAPDESKKTPESQTQHTTKIEPRTARRRRPTPKKRHASPKAQDNNMAIIQ